MTVFRIALAGAWLAMLWLTVRAGQTLGWDQAGDIFLGDMAHPWRAQFNVDFGFHLLLVACWMIWSAPSRLLGFLFAVLSVVGGGAFTFAYLLVRSFQTRGNIRAILLGRHHDAISDKSERNSL